MFNLINKKQLNSEVSLCFDKKVINISNLWKIINLVRNNILYKKKTVNKLKQSLDILTRNHFHNIFLIKKQAIIHVSFNKWFILISAFLLHFQSTFYPKTFLECIIESILTDVYA